MTNAVYSQLQYASELLVIYKLPNLNNKELPIKIHSISLDFRIFTFSLQITDPYVKNGFL